MAVYDSTLRLARDVEPVLFNDTMPRFFSEKWTIDFNALMNAAIIAVNDNSFKVPTQSRTTTDFMGIKWDSEDTHNHEYFRYSTDTDYSDTVMAFRYNSVQPGQTTITIKTPGQDYTYRLAPYALNSSTNRYECLDTTMSTGLSYSADTMKAVADWTTIPDADMVAYAGRKDYIFILDFNNIRLLSDYRGIRIAPLAITGISLDWVQDTNGLGAAATVASIETTSTAGLLKATINNCQAETLLTPGDKLNIVYTASDGFRYEEIMQVESSTGFGTNSRVVYYKGNYHGTLVQQLAFYSRYLIKPAPVVKKDKFTYVYDITVTGLRTQLLCKNYPQEEHDVNMTSGFDDDYSRTPQSVVKQVYALGYRGFWTQYVGMSHYMDAETAFQDIVTGTIYPAGSGALTVDHPEKYYFIGHLKNYTTTTTPVNLPTVEYFKSFFALLKERNYSFVHSVAYEILDFFMPYEWKQRDYLGNEALSGWSPPSSFIQPTNYDALNYVAEVQRQIIVLALAIDLDIRFQVGEPWWWDGSYSNFAPCIYDAATMALYTAETGRPVPPYITNIFNPITADQFLYVDWLCEKLGISTNYIKDRVRSRVAVDYPSAYIKATLLFFTPQIMSPVSAMTKRLNFPITYWVYPIWDFVQIEDYDWIIDGRLDLVPLTFQAAVDILGYPKNQVHYFVGFILKAQDYHIWPYIDTAIKMAILDGLDFVAIWALTQIFRDSVLIRSTPIPQPTRPILNIAPDWDPSYDVAIEYKTEIITSRVGVEQRRALRVVPRRTIEYQATLLGNNWRRIQSFLAGWQNREFILPQLTRSVLSAGPMPNGENQIQLVDLPGWIQLGALVILEFQGIRDIRTVSRLIDNTVEFIERNESQYWPPSTTVYCGMKGYMNSNLSVTQRTNTVAQVAISVNITPGSEVDPWYQTTPPVVFNTVELFSKRANWAKDPSIEYVYDSENVDYGVGTIEVYHPIRFSKRTRKQTYLGRNRSEVEEIEAFWHRMKGMQGVFYAPTWDTDMQLANGATAGSSLLVQNADIYDYLSLDAVYRNIAIITTDGSVHCYSINTVTLVGSNSQLNLTSSVSSQVFGSILMICWLPLWRLATDKLVISWRNDQVAEFEMSLITLQDTERTQETVADAIPDPVQGINR